MWNDIEKYVDELSGAYEIPTDGGIEGDSAMRNYVAQQLQRLQDNGLADFSDNRFYQDVGDKSGFSGFNETTAGGILWLSQVEDKRSIGTTELTALALTMAHLDQLQNDGRITAADYAGYVQKLVSPGCIDDIEAHGGDGFYNLLDDIDREDRNEPDAGVAEKNRDAMSVDTRPFINDKDDYYTSARDADPARAAREAESDYDPYSLMGDKLAEAKKSGYLTDEQYDAAANALRAKMTEGVSGKAANMLLYAMEDAAALGDEGLIGEIMSPDGIAAIADEPIMADTPYAGMLNYQAVDILSRLEQETHVNGIRPAMQAEEPDAPAPQTEDVEPEPEPATEPEPEDSVPTAEPFTGDPVELSGDDIRAITDAMFLGYFEKSEAKGGITLDGFEAQVAEFEAMDEDAQQQGYLSRHPDFHEALTFMNRMDALENGLNDGKLAIGASVDENGVTSYGVMMQDGVSGYDVFISALNGDPSFSEALHDAVSGLEPQEPAPQVDSGGISEDYDADLTGTDLSVLTKKSPEEQFESMRSAAVACWRGDYGNGQDRVDALLAAGFTDDERKQIQSMVNIGPEWCQTATPEDFDSKFPSEDGTTMAEREAAFQAERAAAAAAVMTYENSSDFMAAVNAAGGQLTEEDAAGLYGSAARVFDQAYAEGGSVLEEAAAGMEDGGLSAAVSNLADYAGEHEGEGFAIETAAEAEPEPENDGPEIGG